MTTTPGNTTAMLPTATDIVATVKACLWPNGSHITESDRTRVQSIGTQLAAWIDAAMPGYELMAAKAKLHDAEQAYYAKRDECDEHKCRIGQLRSQMDTAQAKLAEYEQAKIDLTHAAVMARATVKELEANR